MPTDQDIIKDFHGYYKDAFAAWSPYYPEAEEDLRFYLGDQWTAEERRTLNEEGRNSFVFNKIRRNVDMLTGYQRKHRLASVVIPAEGSDQTVADQKSRLLMHVMNKGEGYNTLSDCFGGALKTAWNLFSIWMDYGDDPVNGDIMFGREPYNSFICDPYFTKTDWSDCNYVIKRKYLSPDQAASLLPSMEKDVRELAKIGSSRDDKFTWLPSQRHAEGETLMAYNEFFVQNWKKIPMIVDMETGEYMEFDVSKERQKAMLEIYPNLKIIKKSKKIIEKHIILNDNLMKTEVDPDGLNEYPFVPVIATWESESDSWDLKLQSLVRPLKDPQKESNRRRSQMIDLLDSQVNSGWIAKENSVVNPRSLFQTAQGKVIWQREDADPSSLQKIPAAQIPPSMFQLQELFDRDIMEIAGINDANFGDAVSQESGVMMMLRQSASLVNLQNLFDNLRLAQKTISHKVVKLFSKWTPEKIKRIINEYPAEGFYDQDSSKYDITISEGLLTDDQRQMYFRQLVDLKQLGAPVTGEMLAEAAPIQGKTEYTKQIAELEQQQAKQAQEQQQVQQQVLQTQSQMSQAKAIADVSMAAERRSRVHSNLALSTERTSEAMQNRAQAALDRAKTMTEISQMNDDRLFKVHQFVKMLEAEDIIDREAVAQKVGAQAEQIDTIMGQQVQGVGQIPQQADQGQLPQQPTGE